MNRRAFLGAAGITALAGCTSVGSMTELQDENDNLTSQIDELEAENSQLRDRLNATNVDVITDDVVADIQTMVSDLQESVVKIDGVGAGFQLSELITTNQQLESEGELERADRTAFSYNVRERREPIAILNSEISIPQLTTGTAAVDDIIFMIGHPYNVGDWVVTVGQKEAIAAGSYPSSRGCAGAPVCNMNGDVIGVHLVSLPINRDNNDEPLQSFVEHPTRSEFYPVEELDI